MWLDWTAREVGTDVKGTSPPSGAEDRLRSAFLIACVSLSLLVCGGLLVYGSGRGADLTDEIFYLVWARDPNAYQLVYQPFGYLLHPLYALVGGNLQVYRLAGFGIAAGAGTLLGYSLATDGPNRATLSLYGAVSALTIFFPWIITPSYNSAANVGALLVIGGIFGILADTPAMRVTGAVATASGLCIAAFAKPPLFAIAVAVVVVVALAKRSARSLALVIAALVLAAAFIWLLLPPSQVVGLVRRIIATQHVLSLPNTALALPAKVARDWLAVPPTLTGSALAAALSLGLRRFRWSAWLGYLAVALSLYYFGSVAADAVDGGIPDFPGIALVLAAAGYAGLLQHESKIHGLAVALLLAAPAAVALGTFNNQWFQLNFSMAFPFLALFALARVDPRWWRRGVAQALAIVGPVVLMVLAAWYPYSLPASIFEQQIPVEHPLTHGSILVDDETATFVRSARGLAQGALVLDLSGTGPGVDAVLGARAPVLLWLNPATPSWPDVVWSRLSADERENAWFILPVWPLFKQSEVARWLAAHKDRFCQKSLPPITFWDEERNLQIWRPCRPLANRASSHEVDHRQ